MENENQAVQETQQEQVNVEPTTQEAPQQDTPVKAFEIPTEVQDLVGEGKKYKSPEDALKSVPHAQEHIKTLEEEMVSLREELAKRRTAEELLDEIKSGAQTEVTPSAEVNQDTIEEIVQRRLEQNELQKQAKTNADSVAHKFMSKYGDQAEAVYNQIAKDSGLSVQQLNNLASTSPNVVLKLAGIGSSEVQTPSKTTGSINTQALENTPKETQASARVPKGASTKDLVSAWRIAGEKIKSQQ